MKTAISIPDPIFNLAEELIKKLSISRSQFYARAVEEFIARNKEQLITKNLNKFYSQTDNSLDEELFSLQQRSLNKEAW